MVCDGRQQLPDLALPHDRQAVDLGVGQAECLRQPTNILWISRPLIGVSFD
jgi:hypothetical protein